MKNNRYEIASAGEGQAPRRNQGGRRIGPCPIWVWILLVFVVLLIIGAAIGSSYAGRNKSADENGLYTGGQGVVEGDMLGIADITTTQNVVKDKSLLWPMARIPYRLDSAIGCPDSPRCEVLMSAIDEFHNSTCLRWEPARETDNHTVEIRLDDTRCQSTVGYQGVNGGDQLLILGHGCFKMGIILHLMGHTIGFWHEHNRPDRDSWLTVNLNHTDSPASFNKYESSLLPPSDSLDFTSVMMYGPRAFSKDGEPTMTSRLADLPLVPLQDKVALSENDRSRIRYIYYFLCRRRDQADS